MRLCAKWVSVNGAPASPLKYSTRKYPVSPELLPFVMEKNKKSLMLPAPQTIGEWVSALRPILGIRYHCLIYAVPEQTFLVSPYLLVGFGTEVIKAHHDQLCLSRLDAPPEPVFAAGEVVIRQDRDELAVVMINHLSGRYMPEESVLQPAYDHLLYELKTACGTGSVKFSPKPEGPVFGGKVEYNRATFRLVVSDVYAGKLMLDTEGFETVPLR